MADTGAGIPIAEQPRVFERFFRGEQALNMGVPGTGLGLSIVAHQAELHDGTIRLESRGVPGEKSRFLVTPPTEPPAGGQAQRMARILVAEDERDIREPIGFTRRQHGHEVLTASNGEDALAIALRELPELALLDNRMSRLTGHDVCRRLRAEPASAHIPVVFPSAIGQDSEAQAGMDAGATDYMLKPFAPDRLVQRVERLLGHPGEGG